MSEGRGRKRGSNAIDRRPLRFWEPFNIWWRSELEKTGRRASSDDIARWYEAQSSSAWGPERPSLQETRTHAKCLRSVSSVRDYFREYRAKKKHEQDELDMDEEEEEGDRRSRSTASRRAAAGSKAAHTNSTAAYSGGAMPSYMAYSNEQGYWGSGYMDGTTSGVSTAAADGAPSGQPDVAQGVVGHGQQHVAALDMSCVHPGALDPSWTTTYQQAAAAGCAAPVTTHGPIVHSSSQPMLAQGTHSDQQQQDQQYGGDVLGGTAGLAGNNNIQLWQQQQQQGHHKQQPQQQQDPLHAPPFGGPATAAAADCTSLSSLFQVPPAPQLEGSLGGYEVEAPCVSPRVKQEPGAVQSAAAGAEVQANINCLAAHVRPQAGTTPPPQGPGEQLEVPQGDQGLEAPAAADPQLQQPAAAQAQVQPWDAAKQQQQQEQYMTAQHQAKMQQGYVWPAAAPAFGGFAPHCTSALPHPQQHQQHQYLCFQQGMHSWWQQHSDCQPQQQPETAAGNGPQMNAVVVNMSAGHLDSLHAAPPAAADAPALAAQAAALQPSTGLTAVCVSHTGQHTHQQVPAALVAPAADPAAAPSAAGGRQAALTTVKLEGGMTSSMLAAAPAPAATLPGCPGHSTVDSILRQLEAGVRSPPGSGVQAAQAGMHGGASVQAYPRMSLSALLEPSGGLHQSLGCGRRLSQSLEHLTLPQHRLSLYTMGSGLLDALTDGLDLDAFLGAADLSGAAGGLAGPGGAAAGDGGGGGPGAGDTIAPVAPGSRVSIRWLRGSFHMQVPDHWQQHMQTLQEAPFRGGLAGALHAGSLSAAPDAAAAGAEAAAAGLGSFALHLGRASSGGISALAEAAAATLAAHPDLLRCSGVAAGTAPLPQAAQSSSAQGVHAGTEGEGAARVAAAAGHKKRSRQQSPRMAGGVFDRGGEGACALQGSKRACGPGAVETEGAGCEVTGLKSEGFKFVLDLASPRPAATAQHRQHPAKLGVTQTQPQSTLQLQQQCGQRQQQQITSQQAGRVIAGSALQEVAGFSPVGASAPPSAGLQQACATQTLEQTAAQAPAQQASTQDPSTHPKRGVVLDLRPEDLGATSENSLPSPQRGTAQHGTTIQQGSAQRQPEAPQQQQQQEAGMGAAHAQQRAGGRRIETLMLPLLQSPGRAGASAGPGAGPSAGGLGARGSLQCGPATAASTTGVAQLGPGGASLPAPAMAHVAMAAAMAAAAGTVRPQGLLGQQQQQQQQGFMGGAMGGVPGAATGFGGVGGGAGAGMMMGHDIVRGRLPAMHEIERMI